MASVHFKESLATFSVQDMISENLPKNNKNIVVLCIGTDRSTGDSLGPLVGYHLEKFRSVPVYGTLEHPVHALNLEETIKKINKTYKNPFIIAIDACLGKLDNIGNVIVSDEPLKPGTGVGKELPPVGDLSIKGVVNVAGFAEMMVLQNTRLYEVMEMSKLIANSLHFSIKKLEKREDVLFI